jgi:hypothetical protein
MRGKFAPYGFPALDLLGDNAVLPRRRFLRQNQRRIRKNWLGVQMESISLCILACYESHFFYFLLDFLFLFIIINYKGANVYTGTTDMDRLCPLVSSLSGSPLGI